MKIASTLLVATVLLTSTGSHAALVGSADGKTVYDTDLNISWLANANLADTNSFSVSGISTNGQMSWTVAGLWIKAINAANYLGYHDWRLPTNNTCSNIGCTDSEMSHLFFSELGGVANQSIADNRYHNSNYSLFQNLQTSPYLSGTAYTPIPGRAWGLDFNTGMQGTSSSGYMLLVRTGQTSVVPVPAAAWLFGSGLLGLIGVARRKITT